MARGHDEDGDNMESELHSDDDGCHHNQEQEEGVDQHEDLSESGFHTSKSAAMAMEPQPG